MSPVRRRRVRVIAAGTGPREDKISGGKSAVEELAIAHCGVPGGFITISVGIESLVPCHGQSAAELVEAADSALYVAKRRGRNRVIGQLPVLLSEAS